MATKLTKKQRGELTEKLAGIIQKNNALQLRLSMDRSVNEMNVNQISGALNRIHGQAIGKKLPAEINIPPRYAGYVIDGIGTIYGGVLNIDDSALSVTHKAVDLGTLTWQRLISYANPIFVATLLNAKSAPFNGLFEQYTPVSNLTEVITTDKSITFISDSVRIRDDEYPTGAAFKEGHIGVYIVYELTTPETYTLTPEQMIQLLDQL